MEVIIHNTAQEASATAARLVAKLIQRKPTTVLGLATGSTPVLLYQELIGLHRNHQIDFSRVTTFNLDEYLGLGPDHPCSYHAFMYENFFNHINIDPKRVFIPDGLTRDVPAHCQDYERKIASAGGIDLQILGIGTDGHIGFNEPTSSLRSRTRIKTLTQNTRADNARLFKSIDEVPHHVVTMGIGTILESKMTILLAFGGNKADAIAKTVEGPLTAMVPASALQMHEKAKIIIDQEAATLLNKRDYYSFVYNNKPAWQRDL